MLTPEQARRVDAALVVADQLAAEARAARPGVVSGFWSWVIGAESSVKGAVASVEASERLAAELHAKADRWRADFRLVEDVEVADFERAAGAVAAPEAARAAELLTPAGAVRDIAPAFVSPSMWPGWLRAALGLAAVVALVVFVVPWVVTLRRARP